MRTTFKQFCKKILSGKIRSSAPYQHEFCEDTIHDKNIPTRLDGEYIKKYLEKIKAVDEAMEAFEVLWPEYLYYLRMNKEISGENDGKK